MQKNRLSSAFICILVLCASLLEKIHASDCKDPRLTVVIIVDQFAYHYLPKLQNNFRYGLRTLFKEGQVYTQAYHAHGIPETTPGHHAISTGTLPKDHGAILNKWINKEYKKECYVTDPDPNAAVFKPQGSSYLDSCPEKAECGKSCVKTMVDGLSDQFMLASNPPSNRKVFALSLKSHPAIATANRLGKPIWFDETFGGFTSSKKYFCSLPEWVIAFNKAQKFSTRSHVVWRTMCRLQDSMYDFPDIKNYDYAGYNFSLVSLPSIAIDRKLSQPFELYLKTPAASQALIDLAKTCITHNLKKSSDRMLLWVSLSTLDLVGHIYGPDSIEAIDTLYHVDKQIQDLMNFIHKRIDPKHCLYVLTGDHGIPPMPELMQKRGIPQARRIMAQTLINDMNNMIAKSYSLNNIIKGFEPTYFIINKELLAQQDCQKQTAILSALKKFLQDQPGIKSVWTAAELRHLTFQPEQPENHYKTQLYHDRSGDLICMPEPYCQITTYPKGTSHLSPYEYDTHVPLVLYQKRRIAHKIIDEKVWIPQLPVTLAYLLHLARPSASTYAILPGVEQ